MMTLFALPGSGAVGGTAEITENGYRINGSWKYASGAHQATHITANCAIKSKGAPVLNDDGEQLVLPFILDKKDVNVLPAWKYIGMVATGSDAFEVKDLEVPRTGSLKLIHRQLRLMGHCIIIHFYNWPRQHLRLIYPASLYILWIYVPMCLTTG
jgi:hypothetical protein